MVYDVKYYHALIYHIQQPLTLKGRSIRLRLLQVAQLSQRDRAAEWVSYGQKWKTVNGRQHFTDIIGLSSTTTT